MSKSIVALLLFISNFALANSPLNVICKVDQVMDSSFFGNSLSLGSTVNVFQGVPETYDVRIGNWQFSSDNGDKITREDNPRYDIRAIAIKSSKSRFTIHIRIKPLDHGLGGEVWVDGSESYSDDHVLAFINCRSR
jgi:hypothetical protein